MKSEKLFEAFTELDDDLIENALPKDRDYDVVKPALKMNSWKPWVAGAAVAAAAFGVVFAGFKLFGSGKPGFVPAFGDSTGDYESGTFESGAFDGPSYAHMLVDYVVYSSAEELVNASDVICTGKVRDISFALLDKQTAMELTENDDQKNGELYTIYEIEVTKMYCDRINNGRIRFRVRGGIEGYKTDEQLALTEKTGDSTILVMDNAPEIKLGEEYLFLLADFDYAPAGGGRMPTIINNTQTAFPLSDPSYRDGFSGASAQDIINCVEGNAPVENKIGVAITHNGNYLTLTDTERENLAAAVKDALANDCLPERQLNTVITEQQIKEYSGSGFVIDLTFNDVDAPLAGGGEDKKARTTCHVTILIKENLSNAYLTYSYTSFDANGNSDQFNGGTYNPSAETLNAILSVIGAGEHNQSNGDHHAEMLFDYFIADNMQWNKTQDFTVPEFEGVTFRWSSEKITAVKNGSEAELFSGMPVWGVYLADLNGDGKREICSTVSNGSGIVDNRIRAYDYANGYLYELENRPTSDYSLKLMDGTLMYVHSMHSVSSLVTEPLTLGHMTCHSTTPGVHHGDETSHHDEPEHTAAIPTPTTPTVTTGTHHSEHDETHH